MKDINAKKDTENMKKANNNEPKSFYLWETP